MPGVSSRLSLAQREGETWIHLIFGDHVLKSLNLTSGQDHCLTKAEGFGDLQHHSRRFGD
jgi:hypothetical protein